MLYKANPLLARVAAPTRIGLEPAADGYRVEPADDGFGRRLADELAQAVHAEIDLVAVDQIQLLQAERHRRILEDERGRARGVRAALLADELPEECGRRVSLLVGERALGLGRHRAQRVVHRLLNHLGGAFYAVDEAVEALVEGLREFSAGGAGHFLAHGGGLIL